MTPEELLPQVYDELRRLAAAKMRGESPDHTFNATALVHEAFLKLGNDQSFGSKSGFFRAAAVAMRRILVDHARSRLAIKQVVKLSESPSTTSRLRSPTQQLWNSTQR